MYSNTLRFFSILLISTLCFVNFSFANDTKVSSLETEHLENPRGVDVTPPKFSWVFDDDTRGAAQSAYQIIISDSQQTVENGDGNIWDSGKINSSNTVNVPFDGEDLESGEMYYWRLKVWDQDGEEAEWSEIQHFQMGLLDESDWQADWITTPDTTISSPLLRNEFTIDKEIESATAFVTGVGYYEFYLNGDKVGAHTLDPALTDFADRILYETYDVTGHLANGTNAAGFWLGNGAFRISPVEGRYSWGRVNNQFGNPMAIMQLHIQYSDGSEEIINSNSDWKSAASPITFNNVYGGEDYDARLEIGDWHSTGYDDSEWHAVELVDRPDVIMDSQVMAPIKVVDTIEPVTRTNPEEGVYLFDLEQNIPGWWRLTVEGERGTEIKIRGAETLNNELFPNPLQPGDSLSTDEGYHRDVWTTYTLKGEGVEVYDPKFFYTGFRYIEVQIDNPDQIESFEVEGRVVHSDLERNGTFNSSHTLLNQIYDATIWSQKGNLHGYPTDCPHREKGGYNGDGQVIAETSMHDFHMHSMYEKWLNDMRDAQEENGRIPNTSPLLLGGMGGGIAWGSAYILIPWWAYEYYEDTSLLEEHYPSMKDYMEYLKDLASNDDGPEEEFIINEFGSYWFSLGEWVAPVGERTGPVNPLTNTYYWYLDALTFADIAGVLGENEDREEYLALAEDIKEAFNEKFFLPEHDLYGTEEVYQGYLLFALSGDLVPEDRRQAVLDNLIEDIQVSRDGHLGTGILGTKHLINFLAEEGRQDVVHQVVTKTTYPSWGYWIENGATTLWESWDAESSHNHQMFGTVSEYLYKYLIGIRAPTNQGTSTGYKEIHISPYIPEDMSWAEGSVETVRGTVSSRWEKSDGSLIMNVTIPANTSGKISIPTMGWSDVEIAENGEVIWGNDGMQQNASGVSSGEQNENYITFEVQSGSYEFELTSSN